MSMPNIRKEPFIRGDTVLVREIWQGKIWTARPWIIVQDNNKLCVIYHPAGTRDKRRKSLTSEKVTAHDLKYNTWVLEDASSDDVWTLKMAIPGADYSVITRRNAIDNALICWYINLEDPENPMHRTEIGFDCTDQILDVIIEPNLKDWRWEDEDELQEAIEAGAISPEKALSLYAKGEEIRDLIMSGKSIFNGWENWKPDPSWKIPVLPEGWDRI
jgi:predicted RNA-binding protein associated with RNAse of E/G family